MDQKAQQCPALLYHQRSRDPHRALSHFGQQDWRSAPEPAAALAKGIKLKIRDLVYTYQNIRQGKGGKEDFYLFI